MSGPGVAEDPVDPLDPAEVLEAGSERRRWFDRLLNPVPMERAPWRAAGLATAAVAGTVAVVAAVVTVLTHGSTGSMTVPPRAHDVARVSMAAIRMLTNQRTALVSYVRETSTAGECALVRVGAAPARSIRATVRSAFPGYVFEDAGQTLDQFTGLCAIEVRAAHGSAVVAVRVTSPSPGVRRPAFTQVETGIETDGGVTTKYALAHTATGWTVLVGASGSTAELPSAQDLVHLAQNAALDW